MSGRNIAGEISYDRAKACGHSSDGDCGSDEVDHNTEALFGLLVARCNSPEFLEFA